VKIGFNAAPDVYLVSQSHGWRGQSPKRVSTWSKRFEMDGLAGLDDKKGRGRKPRIPGAKVAHVLGIA
jgi:hypothetical protein